MHATLLQRGRYVHVCVLCVCCVCVCVCTCSHLSEALRLECVVQLLQLCGQLDKPPTVRRTHTHIHTQTHSTHRPQSLARHHATDNVTQLALRSVSPCVSMCAALRSMGPTHLLPSAVSTYSLPTSGSPLRATGGCAAPLPCSSVSGTVECPVAVTRGVTRQ